MFLQFKNTQSARSPISSLTKDVQVTLLLQCSLIRHKNLCGA